MMNRLLFISLLAWTLTACSDDTANITTPQEEIKVLANFKTTASTRAVGNIWNNADQIGVSGSNKGNVLYSTTSTTTSATFTSATPIYYTAPPSYYDAYYPYQSSPSANTAAQTEFTVTTGPTQNASENERKAIDVLWARTSAAVGSGSAVVFNFTHMMAELVITFEWSGTGFGGTKPASWDFTIGSVDQSATVTVNHTQYTSGWSVPTCTVTASGSTSAYAVTGWTTNTYTMIVPAQNLSSKSFAVTVGGVTYSGALPASLNLAQSTKSTVTIKVSKTGLSVTSATVSAWGNGTETNASISATI